MYHQYLNSRSCYNQFDNFMQAIVAATSEQTHKNKAKPVKNSNNNNRNDGIEWNINEKRKAKNKKQVFYIVQYTI